MRQSAFESCSNALLPVLTIISMQTAYDLWMQWGYRQVEAIAGDHQQSAWLSAQNVCIDPVAFFADINTWLAALLAVVALAVVVFIYCGWGLYRFWSVVRNRRRFIFSMIAACAAVLAFISIRQLYLSGLAIPTSRAVTSFLRQANSEFTILEILKYVNLSLQICTVLWGLLAGAACVCACSSREATQLHACKNIVSKGMILASVMLGAGIYEFRLLLTLPNSLLPESARDILTSAAHQISALAGIKATLMVVVPAAICLVLIDQSGTSLARRQGAYSNSEVIAWKERNSVATGKWESVFSWTASLLPVFASGGISGVLSAFA